MSAHTRTRAIAFAGLVLLVGLFALLPQAAADSVNITYYSIASSNPDANNLSFGTVNNEVQAILGPNNLPILNTAAYGCVSNCFSLPSGPSGVNLTAGGEITYWAPSLNPYVTQTGTGVLPLPINIPSNFFAPNGTGTSDGGLNGFMAAKLSGVLNAGSTESISFTIGADDMAFAFLDGQKVCDLGGVHAVTSGTCTTQIISAGAHTLDVFFVDINTVQSGFLFGVNTKDVTTTPIPEPATFALLGIGLVGFGLKKRFTAN